MTANQTSRSPGAAPNKSLAFNEPSIPITPRGPPKLLLRKNSAHTLSTASAIKLCACSLSQARSLAYPPRPPRPFPPLSAFQTPHFPKTGGGASPAPEDSHRVHPACSPPFEKVGGCPAKQPSLAPRRSKNRGGAPKMSTSPTANPDPIKKGGGVPARHFGTGRPSALFPH